MATSISGALIRDGNGHPVQVSTRVSFIDGSVTPNQSPKTVSSGQTLVLLPPPGALSLAFRGDQDVTWSNTSNQALGYYVATANVDTRVPCAGGAAIYIKTSSSTVVYFAFETI